VLDVFPLSVAEMVYNVATSIPDAIVETLTAVAVLAARWTRTGWTLAGSKCTLPVDAVHRIPAVLR
jgi:hypothetical protein